MEILSLAKIIYRLKPKTVVEIGTAGGGTLFIFCRLASDDATIISIDLPGGPFGGGYPRRRIPLYKAFARHDQKLFLLQEDSHNLKTLHKVKKILDEDKLDFLFLDGDHRYEGVKKDFEMYGPLVRRGGIIAFHDIVQGPPEKVGGVPKFWREIKLNYEYREIVKDWKQGGYGVGVIFV
ncbi:class I SAM-dependent methyltransferase [Candidatus Bathyarchaeota archaeon]|nr:class I SAM-dependent methyltransferase [Candidatus Bathyarchaeota archaeon]